MRRPLLLALATAVGVALAGAAARADAGDRAAAQASFAAAELAAKELRFAEAAAGYRAAVGRDPSAPFASVARARAAHLEARSEGNFGPLAALERVRRDPKLQADPAALDALAAEALTFPRGPVRAEANVVVAEARRRAHDDVGAERALRVAVDDPDAERGMVGVALSDLASLLAGQHREVEALALLDEHPGMMPSLRAGLARTVRRSRLAVGAAVVLGAFVLAGAISAARIALRDGARAVAPALLAPLPLAIALYLGGAGAAVAGARSDGDARPFLLLGVGFAAVVVGARALAIAAKPGAPRVLVAARAGFAAIAAVAAAFLAIVASDAGYLVSFGL